MAVRKRKIAACDIESALDRLVRDPLIPVFPLGRDYLIFSDFHLGDKSGADNFKKNEEIACQMIGYYSKKGYIAVIAGDFEELWQFSNESIQCSYDRFLTLFRDCFSGRLIRIYGNHDARAPHPGLVPGVLLGDESSRRPFLITHGHLGSRESDLYSWFSRICVRLFRNIEPILIKTNLIRAPLFKKPSFRHDFETIHDQWARTRKYRIICGHSHRAVFASRSFYEKLIAQKNKTNNWLKKAQLISRILKEILKHRHVTFHTQNEGVYFNCGCGLYKKGITALEISGGTIRLVKWEKRGRSVYDEMPFKETSQTDL